jgi:mannan endo-1,4-beta-mannosidase
VKEILRQRANKAVIYLSWHATRPTDNAPASEHGQLTDYEWNELLTPGSNLNKHWCDQVDDVAATLRELQKQGVAVLWNPLPEANGKDFWWAGRKGVQGSAGLYRQLFDRLVNHDGLLNLVWVWETANPELRSDNRMGTLDDFFPGLLYIDAIEVRLHDLDSRTFAGRSFAQTTAGKPVGVEVAGDLPSLYAITNFTGWAWFLVTPPVDPVARADAWHKLLADPRIASLPSLQSQ